MFKHFAQFSTSSETWVTRATWATETPKPRKPAVSEPDCPVAQNENAWATEGNRQKTAENRDFSEPVAQVTQVTQKNIRPGIAEWGAEDWRALFEERAGIAEHDGGQSRTDADALAFECCIVQWLNCHLEHSDPDRCAWCEKPDPDGHAVVPFGTENHGHAWVHPECWPKWHERRVRQATEALIEFGLRPPRPSP